MSFFEGKARHYISEDSVNGKKVSLILNSKALIVSDTTPLWGRSKEIREYASAEVCSYAVISQINMGGLKSETWHFSMGPGLRLVDQFEFEMVETCENSGGKSVLLVPLDTRIYFAYCTEQGVVAERVLSVEKTSEEIELLREAGVSVQMWNSGGKSIQEIALLQDLKTIELDISFTDSQYMGFSVLWALCKRRMYHPKQLVSVVFLAAVLYGVFSYQSFLAEQAARIKSEVAQQTSSAFSMNTDHSASARFYQIQNELSHILSSGILLNDVEKISFKDRSVLITGTHENTYPVWAKELSASKQGSSFFLDSKGWRVGYMLAFASDSRSVKGQKGNSTLQKLFGVAKESNSTLAITKSNAGAHVSSHHLTWKMSPFRIGQLNTLIEATKDAAFGNALADCTIQGAAKLADCTFSAVYSYDAKKI